MREMLTEPAYSHGLPLFTLLRWLHVFFIKFFINIYVSCIFDSIRFFVLSLNLLEIIFDSVDGFS